MAPQRLTIVLVVIALLALSTASSLAQTPATFQRVVVDNTHLTDPWGKSAGDINGDGKIDLLAGGNSGGGLLWYENPTWAVHTISTLKGFSTDIEVGDIDRDGLNDVVAIGADANGNTGLFWFKNPGATGSWTATTIDIRSLHDVELADLDGDGDIDIVARDQEIFGSNHGDVIYVYLQVTPTNWTKVTFACTNGEGLKVADLNGDGRNDIIINGTWFENGGNGSTWTAHPYSTTYMQRSVCVAVGDINNDGRPDIALSPSEAVGGTYHVSWFEAPLVPTQPGWTEHIVADPVETDRHGLGIADINVDGFPDIVTAAMSSGSSPQEVAVYYNGGGGTSWVKNVLSTTGSHNIRLVDVDGDGDIDIFGANWQGSEIDLWVNQANPRTPITLDSWSKHIIDPAKPWVSLRLHGVDMDGDGLKDIVTGAWWYKNPGTAGGSWARHAFGDSLYNLVVIYDFDGDGYPDVLCTKGNQVNVVDCHAFAWGRNDGRGNFTVYNTIQSASAGDFMQGADVGRFTPAGPVQVAVSWHNGGNGITMITVPASPATQTWTTTDISPVTQKEALSMGDIDRDGRQDLLLGTHWLRNTTAGWTDQTLFSTSDLPHRNVLIDMNNDGRLDAVIGYQAISVPGKLAWYEQPVTATSPWTEHVIGTIVGPMSLSVVDMNNDGLLDVVAGEHNLNQPSTAKLHIFENKGGALSWTDHVIATGDEHHDGAITVDIDNDGDYDILSMGWGHNEVLLYENLANPTTQLLPPAITLQPAGQTVALGASAAFSVTATGSTPLSYQWKKNGTPIPGALGSSYTTPATTMADSGAQFQCQVTNAAGSVQSQPALLQVSNTPPLITAQPATQTVGAGSTATFSIAATGAAPLTYQWRKNGLDVMGATSTSYTTSATVLADSGSLFSCAVTNGAGTVVSSQALLIVRSVVVPGAPVSDDFSAPTLNTALWKFINPAPVSTLSLVGNGTADARLSIAVPAGSSHDVWTGSNAAPRVMQTVANADFEVEVKFDAALTAGYQMEGLIIEQDSLTYIRFDILRDPTSTRVYCATFSGGSPTNRVDKSITAATPMYLRVKRTGNSFTESYSSNGTTWTAAVTFTFTLAVHSAGPFIGNYGSPASSAPAFAGLIDYFFNTASRIVPEDGGGGTATAPAITGQPANQTVTVGSTASFSVTASGTAPLTYQWQKNTVAITGATAALYTTPATTQADSGAIFRCVVSNTAGSATSNGAALIVNGSRPVITVEPANQTVVQGQRGAFSLTATGSAPLAYQWFRDGAAIPGAAAAQCTTTVTVPADSGALYRCIVTNSAGADTSRSAVLSVLKLLPATVVTQPVNQAVGVGQTAAFAITATGTAPLTYQWQKNGTSISGATAAAYTTPALTMADSGAVFRCVVTNIVRSDTSLPAQLRVSPLPPTITVQPANQTVSIGAAATFSITAAGTPPLTYQWQKNGTPVAGAASATYVTPAVTLADSGAVFLCTVSNSAGSVPSSGALLLVRSLPAGTIISDDFSAPALNTSLWKFVNPLPASTLTMSGTGTADARLSIAVPAGSSHDVWTGGNMAPRIMQTAGNTDFEIEAKFDAAFTSGYQMAGLIVEQDSLTYIRFDFVKDPTSTRIYCATFSAGSPTTRVDKAVTASAPYYLRVKRTGNSWTESYSANGTTWTAAVTFSTTLTVKSVGPFIGNYGSPATSAPAFAGLVDYFFNTAYPVAPEDGVVITNPPVITAQPVNQTVPAGTTATFGVAATGSSPLSYQWQKNGADIAGATGSSCTTPATVQIDSGSTFRCVVKNAYGTVTSNTALLSVVTAVDLIFADGFESGGFSAWSTSATGGGDLAVAAAAALAGSLGMQATINDNTGMYVTDASPAVEGRYRARFIFDPNSIVMASNNAHYIFYAYAGTSTVVLRLELRYASSAYQLRGSLVNNGSTWTNTSWFTLTDAPHAIEIDWRAASTSSAADGGLGLWIDGVSRAGITTVANGTRRIDQISLGPVSGIDAGTRGTYYFDAFESRRLTYIGVTSPGLLPPSAGAQPAGETAETRGDDGSTSGIASTEEEAQQEPVPEEYRLDQNYPNPFNPTTTIQFSVKNSELLILKVYDLLGREVATLADGLVPAGVHTVRFDASGLASGVYIFRITAGTFTASKKMVLMR